MRALASVMSHTTISRLGMIRDSISACGVLRSDKQPQMPTFIRMLFNTECRVSPLPHLIPILFRLFGDPFPETLRETAEHRELEGVFAGACQVHAGMRHLGEG